MIAATKSQNTTQGAQRTVTGPTDTTPAGYSYSVALQGRERAAQRLREAEQEAAGWREAAAAAEARAARAEEAMDRLEAELRRITPPGSAASLVLARYGRTTASAGGCGGAAPVPRVPSPREVLEVEVDIFHRRQMRRRNL